VTNTAKDFNMCAPFTHSQQSSYAPYDDYVRSDYPEVVSPTAAISNKHWLQAALNPLDDPSLSEEIFHQAFGVSLLGVMNGRLSLKWSTCFKEEGKGLMYSPQDPFTLPDITETLGKEIDDLCGASDSQILVLHYLPEDYRPETAFSAIVADVMDTIGARLKLNPRLFIEHFIKQLDKVQEASTHALPSEKDYVQLEHPNGGYITATFASISTHAASSMGKFCTFNQKILAAF
jgi:hypothetical protein